MMYCFGYVFWTCTVQIQYNCKKLLLQFLSIFTILHENAEKLSIRDAQYNFFIWKLNSYTMVQRTAFLINLIIN